MPELRRFGPSVPIVLVGTKLDLRDDKGYLFDHPGASIVTSAQGEELRKQIGAVAYVECSSKTQQNIKAVFDTAIKVVLQPPRKREVLKKKSKRDSSCLMIAHQGFGWVGEWANISSDTNKNPTSQQPIARIQTLYHADTEKTEEHILELVVLLHRLVLQVRNKGFGYSSSNTTGHKTSNKKKKGASSKSNDEALTINNLTEEEKEMLDSVGSKKLPLQRSKSQEAGCSKHNSRQRTTQCNLSKSLGNLNNTKNNTMQKPLYIGKSQMRDENSTTGDENRSCCDEDLLLAELVHV